MKIRWAHIATATAGGVASYTLGSVGFWAHHLTPIMSCLSLMSAAIFVRLARGVSVGPTDALTVDDARRIASAMKSSVRALRALLLVLVFTMAVMIFAPSALSAVKHFQPESLNLIYYLEKCLSSCIGFLLVFVTVRIFSVIQSDIDLAELQAKNLIKSSAKRQGDATEAALQKSSVLMGTSPETYGKNFHQ